MRRDGATIRHRAGVALATAAVFAAVWTVVILLSGGVSIRAGAREIASRDPLRTLLAALACAALATATLGPAETRRLARTIAGNRKTLPARTAVAVSLCVMVVAVAWNTRAVGGSDSSCYVLQAEAFARGRVTLRPPLDDPPGLTPLALAPIGFVPAAAPPHHAVPICAPGLALAMVPAFLVARDAVFLVVPLFAALAVWSTFLLGRALGGEVTGAWAAVLLACSPIFLYQAVQPMSDVPGAALWLAALVALRPRAGGAEDHRFLRECVAGFCASAAVLMRPNVALIVLPLLALLPQKLGSWVRFGAASLPAAAALTTLNAARYGSPLASGYGDTDVLFSFAHVAPNLARYPRWLVETQTPLIALAAIAPLLLWTIGCRRFVLAATAGVVLTLATYLAYTVFDDWWYIRFLLPAVPVLLVFSVIVVRRSIDWGLRSRPSFVRHTLLAATMVAVSAWGVHTARTRSVFDLARLESRFRGAGEYAARALPGNAIVLAVQQSGAIRYYGGRGTLMWDAVPERDLDGLLGRLRGRGFAPLIAVEDGEDAAFRLRFSSQQSGRLDWPPMAEVHGPVRVRIHDPAVRAAFFSGTRIETEHVWTDRRGRGR